jgi:hypothetical protein
MFDELLNPDVEDLVPDPSDDGTFDGTMVNTQPATLKCNGVDVPYDGYYSPAGNLVTWPPGPSIVIFPVDHSVVPTGAECEVGLKSGAVLDKQGVGVPEDQLAAGYTFKIAPLTVAATVPVALKANKDGILPDPASNTPKAPLVVSFNTPVVAESLDVAKVTILQVDKCKDPTTTTPVVAKVVLDPKNKLAIDISDNAATDAWVPSTTYLVTFADSASITDLAGGTGVIKVAGTICFKTGAE